jgi:iron complex transport system ATP-binding protein
MHKLQKLAEKKDIVIVGVVHDLNLAARFGDQISLLNEGKILAHGSASEVLTKENIRKAFHIQPEIFQHNELVFISF